MKVYLAARFSRIEELRQWRLELSTLGHTVTSTWLDFKPTPLAQHANRSGMPDHERAVLAMRDLHDIGVADTIILRSEVMGQADGGNGRLVEFGYAVGQGKKLIVVGPKENLFLCLPTVLHFDAWEDLLYAFGWTHT